MTYTGDEPFLAGGKDIDLTIHDFWCMAYSDLLNDTYREMLAEFLVHTALQSRINRSPFGVTSPSGKRIEVKSAAYLQSCTTDFPSQVLYDITPKLIWNGENYAREVKRNCDIFVFCLYTALTRDTSILDLDYWEFYVLPSSVLNDKIPNQKTISLSYLLKLDPVKTNYAELGPVIESIKL